MTNYSKQELEDLYYSIPKILEKYNHLSTTSIIQKERKIITICDIRQKIDNTIIYNYFYWSSKLKEYVIKEENYTQAKLFILKSYVDNTLSKTSLYKNTENTEKIELKEHEKFKIKNVTYDVDVRGKREIDKIYFSIYDIKKMLDNEHTELAVQRSSKYILDTHYVVLRVKKLNDSSYKNKKYFTYEGLYKYITNSKQKKSKYIFDKIKNTMYVYQFGNNKEKQKLSGKLLGVSFKNVKLLSQLTTSIPCIYLFTLGTVSELRESMTIDKKHGDDNIVCKYGYTKNLIQRATKHKKTYETIKNVVLELEYYIRIDEIYLKKAEDDIRKNIVSNKKLEYGGFKELFIVSERELNSNIKKQYNKIGRDHYDKEKDDHLKYLISSHEKEIASIKHEYESEINNLKHKLEIDNLKHKSEIDNLKHKLEITKMQPNASNFKIN